MMMLYIITFSMGLVSTFFSWSTAQQRKSSLALKFSALWASLLIVVLMSFIDLYIEVIPSGSSWINLFTYYMVFGGLTVLPLIMLIRMKAALKGQACSKTELTLIILSSSLFLVLVFYSIFSKRTIEDRMGLFRVASLPHFLLLIAYMARCLFLSMGIRFLNFRLVSIPMFLTVLLIIADLYKEIYMDNSQSIFFMLTYLFWSVYIIWASIRYESDGSSS